MVLSRTTKISILLGLTGCLFIAELVVGYIVGSLALIADAYHMLNDALSLGIALYAIKLSKRTATAKYSYGWFRAEIIAALTNGVFLLALCFSIAMESIERFVHLPKIDNPKLVVIVGSVGLACNIFGLLLFHEHGHGHGGHSHGGHEEKPQTTSDGLAIERADPIVRRSNSIHSMVGHPVQTRAAFRQAAQDYYDATVAENSVDLAERGQITESPRFEDNNTEKTQNEAVSQPQHRSFSLSKGHSHSHQGKHATKSEGSLNIRGVVLHVLGDALGSLGVVASGLVIWLTKSEKRYYADPALSMAITVLIMFSAVPLVRSAAFILLQGTPSSVSLSDVRAEISQVHGVDSVHELHVWQLSETRIIASVHIRVSTRHYMDIVRDVKEVLHKHGIHSGTVQPEMVDDDSEAKDCLIKCPPDSCDAKDICCPLPSIKED